MWCPACGGEYREGITRCADCDVPLAPSPPARSAVRSGPFFPTMPAPVPAEPVQVAGKDLRCQFCGYDGFLERRAQLNTALLSFLDLDWTNKSATVFACTRCGFLHWFLPSAQEEGLVTAESRAAQTPEEASELVECLSCGGMMEAGSRKCEECGWTYG